jgi:hypothetical protein
MIMERDKKLAELVREHGVIHAPDRFTADVLEKIEESTIKTKYKPIINRFAIYGIAVVFILMLVVISQHDESTREPLFSIPEWDISFPEISPLFSTGLAAGIVGIFFLLLSEFGLRRKG